MCTNQPAKPCFPKDMPPRRSSGPGTDFVAKATPLSWTFCGLVRPSHGPSIRFSCPTANQSRQSPIDRLRQLACVLCLSRKYTFTSVVGYCRINAPSPLPQRPLQASRSDQAETVVCAGAACCRFDHSVRTDACEIRNPPIDWSLLPPGDPTMTRHVNLRYEQPLVPQPCNCPQRLQPRSSRRAHVRTIAIYLNLGHPRSIGGVLGLGERQIDAGVRHGVCPPEPPVRRKRWQKFLWRDLAALQSRQATEIILDLARVARPCDRRRRIDPVLPKTRKRVRIGSESRQAFFGGGSRHGIYGLRDRQPLILKDCARGGSPECP